MVLQGRPNAAYIVTIGAYGTGAMLALTQYWPRLNGESARTLFLFMAFLAFFQLRSIAFSDRFNFSLGTVVVFPAVFVYGIGIAMLLEIWGGVIDAVVRRTRWDRWLFNMAQLSLSAMMGGLAFQWAGGEFGHLSVPHSLPPLIAGVVAYSVFNMGSVTFIVSRRLRTTWAQIFKDISLDAHFNCAVVGFMGAVYALFVTTWNHWGLLVFGLMLAGITELMVMGMKVNVEQNLRQEAEAALLVDSKTGAKNFRFMNEWLMSTEGEGVKTETVLFIDLDDFKVFNDQYGHQQGDEALVRVSDGIRQLIRDQQDSVVRYGGEEFVVILPGLDKSGGLAVAQRIREHLSEICHGQACGSLTVSIGLASRPCDANSRPDLVRKADLAMYQAKAQGKDRCCPWLPEWETNTELLRKRKEQRSEAWAQQGS